MKPQEVFESCLERAFQYRDILAKPGSDARHKRIQEYLANFELSAMHALRNKPGQLKVFFVYYMNGNPYREAINKLGVRPGTFDWWCGELKRHVGRELVKRGLSGGPKILKNKV